MSIIRDLNRLSRSGNAKGVCVASRWLATLCATHVRGDEMTGDEGRGTPTRQIVLITLIFQSSSYLGQTIGQQPAVACRTLRRID